jgi:muramidase (phage lysozyme)
MRTDSMRDGRADGGTDILYITGTFLEYASMPQKKTIRYSAI